MNDSGRYYIIDKESGRKFCVEPIGNPHITWGDVDPASKSITGHYGEKHKGSINESESIITPENGFKNIVTLPPGVSPDEYLREILKNK